MRAYGDLSTRWLRRVQPVAARRGRFGVQRGLRRRQPRTSRRPWARVARTHAVSSSEARGVTTTSRLHSPPHLGMRTGTQSDTACDGVGVAAQRAAPCATHRLRTTASRVACSRCGSQRLAGAGMTGGRGCGASLHTCSSAASVLRVDLAADSELWCALAVAGAALRRAAPPPWGRLTGAQHGGGEGAVRPVDSGGGPAHPDGVPLASTPQAAFALQSDAATLVVTSCVLRWLRAAVAYGAAPRARLLLCGAMRERCRALAHLRLSLALNAEVRAVLPLHVERESSFPILAAAAKASFFVSASSLLWLELWAGNGVSWFRSYYDH